MDCINGAHQRMRGGDLVVPVCADQQEIPYFGLGDRRSRNSMVAASSSLVEPSKRSRYAGSQAEESRQFQRPAEESTEGHASGILEYQHRSPEVMSERQRPRRPIRINLVPKGIFMLEPLQAFQSGIFMCGDLLNVFLKKSLSSQSLVLGYAS
jgi:hypothetical protein